MFCLLCSVIAFNCLECTSAFALLHLGCFGINDVLLSDALTVEELCLVKMLVGLQLQLTVCQRVAPI